MTAEQIKKEIDQAQKALRGAEKMGIEKFVTKAKDKIAKLESELAGLEKSDEKPEPKEKKAIATKKKPAKKSKKPAMGKGMKQIIKEQETDSISIVDSEKKWKYGSKVIKHSDSHYIVLYNSDTTKDAEIKLGEDGNWELICKEVKDYPKFKKGQVEMAINFVLEVKDCIHSKVSRMEQAKKRKEIRKKYDAKSDSEKAVDTVDKAAESVEKRVEEAKEEGKDITPKAADNIALDIKAIVKAVKSGLSDDAKRKAFIQKLISELQKMLK